MSISFRESRYITWCIQRTSKYHPESVRFATKSMDKVIDVETTTIGSRENVLRCQMRPGADLCPTSCPLLQIYSVLCVISQYQEYMAGRGTAADDYEYGVSILRVSQRKQDRDKRRKKVHLLGVG
ncbi:hypothetical protein E2986_10811 [Frieseomelitta varia]|uniref:Uncharacterized protein n=1 Tax=Frieseomelitta varia TaxID=561572 RepID=A0A833S2J1_9HYME|nr:hypothetical protein E2986_10811 [Frieseomelitta varia]